MSDVFQCKDVYMYFVLLFCCYDNVAYEFDSMEISEFCEGNLQNTFLQLKEPKIFVNMML